MDRELSVELRPIGGVRPAGVVLPAGEGELEGRVDPLHRLVQPEHGPDAGVVLPQDQVGPAAELVQQHDPGPAQGRDGATSGARVSRMRRRSGSVISAGHNP